MRMTRFAAAMVALCALLWLGSAAAPGAGTGTSSASGAPAGTTSGWWQNRSADKWWALPLGLVLAAAMGGILGTSVRMVGTRRQKPPAREVQPSAPDTWPNVPPPKPDEQPPGPGMRSPAPRGPGSASSSPEVPFVEYPPDVPGNSLPAETTSNRAIWTPPPDRVTPGVPEPLPAVSMPAVSESEWGARTGPRLLHGGERDDGPRLDAAMRRIGGADAMSITYAEAMQQTGPTSGLRLLLDTTMDSALVGVLRSQGIDAVHLLDIDATPGAFAAASNDDRVLLTSDVGYIDDLIIGGETRPSVLLAGDAEATIDEYATAIEAAAPTATRALENGALVVLGDDRIRVRDLPLRWCRPASPRAWSGDDATRPDTAGPGETMPTQSPLSENAYGRDPGRS
ncbi:hypothetical protein [Nocardia alni]|uniref:hypothetical protein n=1 Tax=Nocardia alni TaxID=2815723 RepID=UPI001C22C83E|nr:hypothetical protein [Nocardia alni]